MTAKDYTKKVKTVFGLEITPEDQVEYEFLKASGLLLNEGPKEVVGAAVVDTVAAPVADKK